MAETTELELHFIRQHEKHSLPAPLFHVLRRPTDRAHFAMKMMERFGLILADEDGEDSAGRQKGRRLTPAEAAELACETSDALFSAMEKRDWFVPIPTLKEIEDEVEARENQKENGGLFKGKDQ